MILLSRLSGEWFRAAGLAIGLAFALGGCSISIPIPGFTDNHSTGAIKPQASANPFDARDWPLVEPALRTAIRAEATPDPVAWTNPDTRRRGEVVAVASPFMQDGASCRAFLARIEEPEGSRSLQGVGCARAAGELAILDVAPWKGL